MYLPLTEDYIDVSLKETKSELYEALSKFDAGKIILGAEAEQERQFYIIKVALEDIENLGIGIISEGHGLKPQILFDAVSKKLMIGFNNEVTIINCPKRTIESRIILNSLFYSFLLLNEPKMIVVIQETGVLALNEEGKQLWQHDSDIIENYKIVDGILHLDFMDSEPIALSIADGQILN
jgi:hypothetical protein